MNLQTNELSFFAVRARRLQAERERNEILRLRASRIQAANDAVVAHLRTGGSRDYRSAFLHVQRTRPELFTDMHVPARGVVAGNYNHNHDALGRFASGIGAGGVARRVIHINQISLHRGSSTGSITDHSGYRNRSDADCVLVSLQTVGATLGGETNKDNIMRYINETTRTTVNWDVGLNTSGAAVYAGILQSVLARMGLQGDARFGANRYTSMADLAADLRTRGTPAIANVITRNVGGHLNEHSVTMPWNPTTERFDMNNLAAQGGSTSHTEREFVGGDIRVDAQRSSGRVTSHLRLDLRNVPVIHVRNR